MKLKSRILTLAALGTMAVATPAAAQELYTYTLSAFGGLGGSLDADPGDDLDGSSLQVGFSLITEPRTRVALRAGELGLASDGQFESLFDAELSYVTLAGEYRFQESYYAPWAYIGLGAYRVEGDDTAIHDKVDDTAIGLVIGLVGEFTLTRRLDFVVEVSGHYADLEDASIFAMGHAGLALHF